MDWLSPAHLLRRAFGAPAAAVQVLAPAAQPQASAMHRMAEQLAGETPASIVNLARTSGARLAPAAWMPPQSDAGVHVTHALAFMQAAVWACIDALSAPLAASDWNVYAGVRGADQKQSLPDDGLQYVLNTRFNPDMTAQAGKRAMMIAAVGYGTGYAEIERDLAGRIVALWPIAPYRCQKVRNDAGRIVLRVSQDVQGGTVDLEMWDVFQIQGASLTGLEGDDMIAKAIGTIARSIATDRFASSYFANGTHLGGSLESDKTLSDTQIERLQKQLDDKYKGSRNAHRTIVLEGGLKYNPFQSKASDAQLVDVKNQITEEVGRWFRVPPHKIGHLLRSTNNNIEHQGLEFVRDSLRPWKVEIEQECDFKLIPYRQRKFIEIDLDWASEGDFGSRIEAYAKGISGGIYTPNAVLRKLGENTIGAKGDVHMVQGAMMRLEDVGKNMLPKAQPAKTEQPAEPALQAWLASTYARIQRRAENRARDLQRGGHDHAETIARSATTAYAEEQIAEMADALGDRLSAAYRGALAVLDGTDPQQAAAAAMEQP